MRKIVLLLFCLFSSLAFASLNVNTWFLIGSRNDEKYLKNQDRQPEEFTFVRLIYSGRVPHYIKNWYTDFPNGDENLNYELKKITNLNIAEDTRAIAIGNPDLFNYPFVYSSEAGQMILSSSEAKTLRKYLDHGGFWMIDDFWGSVEWEDFQKEMKKVYPDRQIVELPITHEIFHTFFEIKNIVQVPNTGYAYCRFACQTWEGDGYEPKVRAIVDEKNQIKVLINWNTDLMDGSEGVDIPTYPANFSLFSFKMFTNSVIYSMTH